MTIHKKKSGKEYFDKCRKVTAQCIREFGELIRADGKGNPESEMNCAMTVLVNCLDGNYPQD